MKQFKFKQDYGMHKQGDILQYDEDLYHGYIHPLIVRKIVEVVRDNVKVPISKPKEDIMDLNGDGVEDAKDARIAGKVLARRRYKKKQGD